MQPETIRTFSAGYYKIHGIPNNQSPNWFESESNNHDIFLWIPSGYKTPLHQAQTHALCATRRETRQDTVLTLSIAPECGPIYTDWKVSIDEERNGINISGKCEFTGFHQVEYMGPPEMHTYAFRRDREGTPLYYEYYREAEILCDNGDKRFRRSRRSGLVMYSGCWPRYHSDGSWWEGAHENSYLTFDNDDELREQWEWIFEQEKWENKWNNRKIN
jgi:hypothetical protein